MTQALLEAVQGAEKAVTQLVEACRKGGPLYVKTPRAVAQVSRTSKWLLNALSRLKRELNSLP